MVAIEGALQLDLKVAEVELLYAQSEFLQQL